MHEVHLQLSGEVDIAVTPALRQRLLDATDRHDQTRLVLDLTDVTLLDASAMGLIASAARAYGEVELRNPSRQNRRVLDLVRLGEVAKITG